MLTHYLNYKTLEEDCIHCYYFPFSLTKMDFLLHCFHAPLISLSFRPR